MMGEVCTERHLAFKCVHYTCNSLKFLKERAASFIVLGQIPDGIAKGVFISVHFQNSRRSLLTN
ncbi:hypothetical protein ANCDUO_00333 [Ancylostoma duodenale]|uniref:Uncharacterized protein n=1 Tax=Ancylostoma duodenale TaxID=51022 RepID=A0A0C2DH96_9BILA|nr:hypothetical protein ANCDUO_00333 [Ancylostoma duodenale]